MYKLCTLDDVSSAISKGNDLAFDTETIGFFGRIRLAQFYQKGWDDVLVVEWPDAIMLFAMLSRLKDVNIVLHNASYDISTIQRQIDGYFCPDKFSDTLYLSRLAFPALRGHSLDIVMAAVLTFDPYKLNDISKQDMHKADWSKRILPDEQLLYASIDVKYLLDVYDACKPQESALSYKIDIQSLKYALHFQRNGLWVDTERAEAQYRANQQKIDAIALPVNCNSYKQVRPYIGSDESNGLGLARLALLGNTKARDVKDARKLTKENSFINKFLTTSEEDGRIYGIFAPSAKSGRYTCKDQNLEQLPRATKGLFGAAPGNVIIYADYSQLELRCLAVITECQVLLDVYYNNKDLHNSTAESIFGEGFTVAQRVVSKYCNFNLTYGGGAPMFLNILIKDADLLLELNYVKQIVRKWKRKYAGVAVWQNAAIKAYQRHKLGSTPFGRQYKAKMMTDQMNIEVQGHGADVAKLGMHYMYPMLGQYEAKMVNFIHDAYIIELPDCPDLYKPCAKLVGDSMQKGWVQASGMTNVKDLPMPVQVDVGYNWGDIEYNDGSVYRYEC